ncbi:MAG: carbohydrate binding family 9 domain-containing protein [Bacteroidetes bacterium]|nr:carbohydrate binding family 9 domain-containing protein [Bacteroidota bacterium]
MSYSKLIPYLRIQILILSILITTSAFNQEQEKIKTFQATKINQPIKIDGVLDEPEWNNLPLLSGFIQYSPYNGADPSKPTKARVGYDETGIYFGIICEENGKDSVMTEITQRDNDEAFVDRVGIMLSPYNDGINVLYFIVTAAGVQVDVKFTENGTDFSWNPVWESQVNIEDSEWTAEIKIPYSALRFPKNNVQDWGINIWRKRVSFNEWSSWNYVSNDIQGFYRVNGLIQDIEIKETPVRLSLSPYISTYVERNISKEWSSNFNAGMDLKYGISESFTLDAILIPDFGQVQSDDQVLNLTPYEIRYNERRQFFTEGTELFNKGDIFYSRRIGSQPKGKNKAYDNLNTNEIVTENPNETKLINALKFSGRTNKGLGIGILNAMTGNTFASVNDTITGDSREISTQPFTNYNLIALDQNLFKNSYLSIINSNVSGKDIMANVTATEFKFADKDNRYRIKGVGALSKVLNGSEKETGYKFNIEAGKFRGNFQYLYRLSAISNKYNQNDLGYLSRNNEFNNTFSTGYHIYEPFGKFLDMHHSIWVNYNRLMEPSSFTEFRFAYIIETRLKNNYHFRMHAALGPLEGRDYYEPRVTGRFFRTPRYYHNCITLTTDNRKPLVLSFDADITNSYQSDYKIENMSLNIGSTYRINNQFNVAYLLSFDSNKNELGFVEKSANAEQIYFGKRTRKTFENTLSVNYLFNNKASFNFRLRHYWSQAIYDSYYELMDDGYLTLSSLNANHDVNYSTFNVDMTYIWNFAPGSELRINWKNTSYNQQMDTDDNIWGNLSNTFNLPHANIFSVKLLYYIDYQAIKSMIK